MKGVELQLGGGLGIGDSNLLQCAFGLRLLALRQLGEYVVSAVLGSPFD
jgi:hypothetical protein